jgi:hypothetical protein
MTSRTTQRSGRTLRSNPFAGPGAGTGPATARHCPLPPA